MAFFSDITGDKLHSGLSGYNFPFKKDKIESVSTLSSKDESGNWIFVGRVNFKNGRTTGHQEFAANDFISLLKQIEAFIEKDLS